MTSNSLAPLCKSASTQIQFSAFHDHEQQLKSLAEQSRLRRLIRRSGRDFSSNDYLGLAQSAELKAAAVEALSRGVPIGAGGSRLLRGNHEEHELLEEEAARFFGSKAALFFPCGYSANSAIFSTLPQRGDLVVYDELIHASVHEGLRLARAERRAFAHNDPDALVACIKAWRAMGGTGRVWVAAEALYSMDGDQAPIGELASISNEHDAILVIDEAHSTGVFGPNGRGLAAGLQGADNLITLHTCGKALGAEGAIVCGPRTVRDFLVNRGRGFIFSTAPSPLMAAVVRASLRLLVEQPSRRERLHSLIGFADNHLAASGAVASRSQIVPLIIGDDARTMEVAARLQRMGFDVRGIRPPTVPAGTSRLRISLTLNIGNDDVMALAVALEEVAR